MVSTLPAPVLPAQSRRSFAKLPDVLDLPSLIEVQLNSYDWLRRIGLKELFDEVSPITDFAGGRFELHFLDYEFRDPKYSEAECRIRDATYASPLYAKVHLLIKQTGEVKEQDLFMGDIPLMTSQGTFIINGAERVVVSQLVRSPGVYFTREIDPASGRGLCAAKLIPNRGAWMELETSNKNIISAKVDRKRKIPITTLLRCIGYSTSDQLRELFKDIDLEGAQSYIESTLEKDAGIASQEEALIELYRRLRPGEPPTAENAQSLLNALFFNVRRYDLGKVGRYKVNKRLGSDLLKVAGLGQHEVQQVQNALAQNTISHELLAGLLPEEKAERVFQVLTNRALNNEDLVAIVRKVILVNKGEDGVDDIDHLGNRRVKGVGELIQNQFRIGLLRMERVVRERMTLTEPETAVPGALVNIRPIVASIKEFFGGSQLSQFMDQTNPLAELTHKRRLSALGPGGLSRERAGFDVRDVHHSHYGRICPIETPEGPNIGLLGSLATYSKINEYGFIETPYRRVVKELASDDPALLKKTLAATISADGKKTVAKKGRVIDKKLAAKLAELPEMMVKIRPFVSDEIKYLAADEEERYVIAQANCRLDDQNQFISDKIEARFGETFRTEDAENVDFMDVSPKQIVSVSTALIPFLEHDDANRALMGSNMQRQAVPLLRPESPLIGTGMEAYVAKDSGQVRVAQVAGDVVSVSGQDITVLDEEANEHHYPLLKFVRSNQGTCINQRPIVRKGDRVVPGQVLADSSSTDQGELALGQNVLCAFMSWEGYNYEDAIVISERIVKEDKFTSIHIEKHEVQARDTKLGAEEITRDIPNVGEESLADLDESGIIRIGAVVAPGDILVGKITPKGETELTAEEKLLRAIFGEKAREIKDTCLRVPHGEKGKVIDVKVFTRDSKDELPPGVNQMVRVWVAQTRKVSEGDKMAGRHGNKGVIAVILPEEEMPFLPDGTPIDIVLNPIGVPSRMNLGQILETHLGLAAQALGFKVMSPVFDGATDKSIEDALSRVWITQQASAANANPQDGGQRNGQQTQQTVIDWLNEKGYDGEKVMSDQHLGVAREVCLRFWLEDLGVDPDDATDGDLQRKLQEAISTYNVIPPFFGKAILRDGRSGAPFDQPITIGPIYMMKLIHLVEDKIHARSTGPYSLITQQPLGGKAQFGGQRFGEMEVWALEAYSAAYTLQEMLTVKSDDVAGRVKTYESIIKGEDVFQPGVPESFRVLQKELQSLGLSVELLSEEAEDQDEEEEPEEQRQEIDIIGQIEPETPEPKQEEL
ncbi:MAG: DNA-directed RNA polymerase subunit beta [Dehalococcoidia bacterium]